MIAYIRVRVYFRSPANSTTVRPSTHNISSNCLPTSNSFPPAAPRQPHHQEMLGMPQRAPPRPPVLLPPPGKPAELSMLVKSLPEYRQIGEITLLGPSERPKPVAEAQMARKGWRWIGNGNWEQRWGHVHKSHPNCHYADHGITFLQNVLGASSAAHHVVRLALPTTDGPMGNCVVNIRLPSHEVIGRSVPAGRGTSPWRSAKMDVTDLRKVDNGLENTTGKTHIYCAKCLRDVSQSAAILNEISLNPCIRSTDGLLDGLTLATNPKPPDSGWSRRPIAMIEGIYTRQTYAGEIAHRGVDSLEESLPLTKYNQIPQVTYCPPAGMDSSIAVTMLHLPWYYSSHRDGHLKSQRTIINRGRVLVGSQLKLAIGTIDNSNRLMLRYSRKIGKARSNGSVRVDAVPICDEALSQLSAF
ncbi:hypothetical protein BU17DRAFT_97082 [Hysterangium stoloniferum]|nr:hypothetical protein BU17DRAFT_97082 [Hysterangium stoloniferum]